MTVQTQDNKVIYESDGITTSYPFVFQVNDIAHIEVYDDAVLTILNHEVILNADQEINPGGVMNYLDPPPLDEVSIVILRFIPMDQDIDYSTYDGFPADTHEAGLDNAILMIQQLQEQLNRATLAPIDEI